MVIRTVYFTAEAIIELFNQLGSPMFPREAEVCAVDSDRMTRCVSIDFTSPAGVWARGEGGTQYVDKTITRYDVWMLVRDYRRRLMGNRGPWSTPDMFRRSV